MDNNGDGQIFKDELRKDETVTDLKTSEDRKAKVKDFFSKHDANQDGVVTQEEYVESIVALFDSTIEQNFVQ